MSNDSEWSQSIGNRYFRYLAKPEISFGLNEERRSQFHVRNAIAVCDSLFRLKTRFHVKLGTNRPASMFVTQIFFSFVRKF